MYEGAQRVESFFDRARVREETSTGGAVSSSGSATDLTDAQTVKRKAEETVETDAQAKKRQTAATPVPTVRVAGSGRSGAEHSHSHSSMQTANSSGAIRGAAGHEELH